MLYDWDRDFPGVSFKKTCFVACAALLKQVAMVMRLKRCQMQLQVPTGSRF